MHELTQRCGSPIHPETLNPAMPSGTNPLYPPYTRYYFSDHQQNLVNVRLEQKAMSIYRLPYMKSVIPGTLRER